MSEMIVYNKSDMIEVVHNNLKIDGASIKKEQVANVIDYFIDAIKDVVTDGNTIKLKGFMTFDTKHVGVRNNFGVVAPEHDVVRVKVSPSWKKLPQAE